MHDDDADANESFKILRTINCNSTNVIYTLPAPNGTDNTSEKTRKTKTQIHQIFTKYYKKTRYSVAKHFNQP